MISLSKREANGRSWSALLIVPALAFLYSLWTIGGSGRDTVYWGFLLLLAGIPLYVWNKLRYAGPDARTTA
jgi:APA family basic amino acid/polyamine antiporter